MLRKYLANIDRPGPDKKYVGIDGGAMPKRIKKTQDAGKHIFISPYPLFAEYHLQIDTSPSLILGGWVIHN